MDGKHILIRPPPASGSMCINYKSSHSIILLAVVDASYKFIYVDVGKNGGVWNTCTLKDAIEKNLLNNVPPPCTLPESELHVPHMLIADDAFPHKPYLMKPFYFRAQNAEQKVFSYRLSCARHTVENAFGIMADRSRVFLSPI